MYHNCRQIRISRGQTACFGHITSIPAGQLSPATRVYPRTTPDRAPACAGCGTAGAANPISCQSRRQIGTWRVHLPSGQYICSRKANLRFTMSELQPTARHCRMMRNYCMTQESRTAGDLRSMMNSLLPCLVSVAAVHRTGRDTR